MEHATRRHVDGVIYDTFCIPQGVGNSGEAVRISGRDGEKEDDDGDKERKYSGHLGSRPSDDERKEEDEAFGGVRNPRESDVEKEKKQGEG